MSKECGTKKERNVGAKGMKEWGRERNGFLSCLLGDVLNQEK
jgi:hypothetical protein